MGRIANVAVAAAVAVGVGAAASAAARGGEGSIGDVLGPEPVTVVVDIEHSAFRPSRLAVAEGTEVRFVVVNGDPINHELIVGPPAVHERHREGDEPRHDAVPGEVSVGPLERAVTTYTFDEPGTVEIACHLPGHYDYGMRGQVEVVAGG